MVALLLPGIDGSGTLFRRFVELLPKTVEPTIVRYPADRYLTYDQLAQWSAGAIPTNEPYVIIAESYSGPIATLLAARPTGDLRAVVYVSSFVTRPSGRIATWIARALPPALFRIHPPAWFLRWLLMDSDSTAAQVAEVQIAIASVNPTVMHRRLLDALTVGFTQFESPRTVCIYAESDQLLAERGLRSILRANPKTEAVKVAGPHLLLQCSAHKTTEALQKLKLFGS